MTRYGEKYEAPYNPDGRRDAILTRRAVYKMAGDPTPEQSAAIDRVEEIIHKERINGDPYRVMRKAEYLGIELGEEYLVDGRWCPFPPNNDAELTLMQKGSL